MKNIALTFSLAAVFFLCLLTMFPHAAKAENVGAPCSTLGVTKLADDLTTTIGCFKVTASQPDCGTEAAPTCIYKSMTPSNIIPPYSETCNDWSASGYTSMDACIHDGRWHVVYANNGTGGTTFGNLATLISYSSKGANVRAATNFYGTVLDCSTISVWGVVTCGSGQPPSLWQGMGATYINTNGVAYIVTYVYGGATSVYNPSGISANWYVKF